MDAKVRIKNKNDFNKLQAWAFGSDKMFISYHMDIIQIIIEETVSFCPDLCEDCVDNEDCSAVDLVLMSVDEFLKWKEEAKQLASDKPKFKDGDQVFIEGTIYGNKTEDGFYNVEFENHDSLCDIYIKPNNLLKSIPTNKKESQDLVYDLYQKIKSLTEENEKLKQVVFAKETLDQSKEIKQIVNDGRTPKASIMINSEKSIDLSEIDDDQYILRGNY